MPLQHKTFVKVTTLESVTTDLANLDQEVNDYLAKQHWSQARDAFQTCTVKDDKVLISRTVVYTTEQLAFGPNKPPVQ